MEHLLFFARFALELSDHFDYLQGCMCFSIVSFIESHLTSKEIKSSLQCSICITEKLNVPQIFSLDNSYLQKIVVVKFSPAPKEESRRKFSQHAKLFDILENS